MKTTINKKVSMTLVGLDGNAFSLMATFRKNALKQGWSEEEVNTVLNECMSGDYDHLLQTLIAYTTEDENEE